MVCIDFNCLPPQHPLKLLQDFYCDLEFNFGNTVFGLHHGKFPIEERYRHVTLSYHCSQLHRGGMSVFLKRLCKVWVGQDYLFGNGSFYIVKCLLMD
jgi:hypothetical protein